MLAAISDAVPTQPIVQPLPERTAPASKPKSLFFGRSKAQELRSSSEFKPATPPLSVTAQLDEVHFRSENEFGLYETLSGRCVLVTVDVR